MITKVNRNLNSIKEYRAVYVGITTGKNNEFHKTIDSIMKEVNQLPGAKGIDKIIKWLPQGNWTGRTEITMIFSS